MDCIDNIYRSDVFNYKYKTQYLFTWHCSDKDKVKNKSKLVSLTFGNMSVLNIFLNHRNRNWY